MTDNEYRALIEYHAGQLTSVTREPAPGYSVMRKDRIFEHIKRLQELAANLEG